MTGNEDIDARRNGVDSTVKAQGGTTNAPARRRPTSKRHLLTAAAVAALTAQFLLPAEAAAQSRPAGAADQRDTDQPPQTALEASDPSAVADIIVTAQRQSQRLQDVPIAVTALGADTLSKQQVVNTVSLQQALPNTTFTKTNFAGSSFTIRGVGDLCVGISCDSATAIHVNDMPLLGTRLFESEFFDLERVEVLRGPQGTLFGRNATSGVVNFITAKPDLSGIHAAGEFEYGNYDSKRLRGMFNLPLTDTIGIRVAGTYLNRGGFTQNLYDGSRIDGRDLYSVRGTLSWKPDSNTRIDLIGYYFRERDDRARNQKQMCHRDPTGILGCLPDSLAYETVNNNSSLFTTLTSREFLQIATGSAANPAGLSGFALHSVYGTDSFASTVNPSDKRVVTSDFNPNYFAEEQQYTLKAFHDFGPVTFNFTGGYMRNATTSENDYNLAVQAPYVNNPGLLALDAAGRPGGAAPFLINLRQYLIPNGPNGGVCQSAFNRSGTGVFGGNSIGCFPQSVDVAGATQYVRQFSAEAHIDSKFDGPLNFLIGGIYFDSKQKNNDYYVDSFELDYISGLLGSAQSGGTSYLATPFFHVNSAAFRLKSYGIFGETYFAASDKLKFTVGMRYNHDQKATSARLTLLNVLVPFGSASAVPALDSGAADFDPSIAGNQPLAVGSAKFSRLTGRAVVDYRFSRNNMIYASASRGYKSGGINPPLSPVFAVPTTFSPETIDAFEIGSKNTFLSGKLQLNLTGFYYTYKGLQLSRTVARTAVNDNVDANVYGIEAEAVVRPVRRLTANLQFSYLNTRVTRDKLLVDPRDPSGGRSDAVIIKDITNASNCAVLSNSGSASAARSYVNAINGSIAGGTVLRPAVQVLPNGTFGAYSVCSALQNAAASLGSTFGGITVAGSGVETNVRGNQLPGAPTFKASAGLEYLFDIGSTGYTVVPRVDVNYTGKSYARIFNDGADRLKAYTVVNLQVQLNAPDDRFYARAFVRNLTNSDATTGLYVSDPSTGASTNVFTIDPRQYGIAAGFKF